MENLGKELKLQIYKLIVKSIIKYIIKDRNRLRKSSIKIIDIMIRDLKEALKFDDLEELRYLLDRDKVASVLDKTVRASFHINRSILTSILRTSNFSVPAIKVIEVLQELKDIEDLDFKDSENKED